MEKTGHFLKSRFANDTTCGIGYLSISSLNFQMDKASLLAEVISHLKDLRRKAAEASEDSDSVIPNDIDEVKVEPHYELVEGRPCSIRVSLSCDYKPGLLSDIRQALDALHLIIMQAEIATLGCRMKNVFVMTTCKEEKAEGDEVRHFHARSVCQALRSVIEKFSASEEFLKTTLPSKRRRISMFNP